MDQVKDVAQTVESLPAGANPPVNVSNLPDQSNRVSPNFNLQFPYVIQWVISAVSPPNNPIGSPTNITFDIMQDNKGHDSTLATDVRPGLSTTGTLGKEGMCYIGNLAYTDPATKQVYRRADVFTHLDISQFTLSVNQVS